MDPNDLYIINFDSAKLQNDLNSGPQVTSSKDTKDLNWLLSVDEKAVAEPAASPQGMPEQGSSDIEWLLRTTGPVSPKLEREFQTEKEDTQQHIMPNAGNNFDWEEYVKSALRYDTGDTSDMDPEKPGKRPPEGEYWWQAASPGELIKDADEIASLYWDPVRDENGEPVLDSEGDPLYWRSTNRPQWSEMSTSGKMGNAGIEDRSATAPMKEHVGLMGKAADMILGTHITNLDDTIRHIMYGDSQMKQEAFFGILNDIMWWVPEAMSSMFTGVERNAVKAIIAQTAKGPVTDQMINQALKARLPGRSEMEVLKHQFLTGHATPRMMVKTLDKILPTALKNKLIKTNIWENFAVPVIEYLPKKAVSARFMPAFIFGEKDIPWKSLAEIWQPGIERAHQKGMGADIRYATAKRQLNTAAGEEFSQRLLAETPRNRMDAILEAGGTDTKNSVAKALAREYKAELSRQGMTWEYRKTLMPVLDKALKKLQPTFMQDPATAARVDKVFTEIDKVLSGKKVKPKHIQAELARHIEDPLLPDLAKSVLYDIHDLPFTTATDIANGSRKASQTWMVESLKKRGDIVSVTKKGDMVLSNYPGLKGMWVDRDVELELRAMQSIPEMSNRMYNKLFMSPWKTMKVIVRPATHIRNIMSNTILNDWGGLPFYRWDYYVQAGKKFGKDSGAFREWKNATGIPGTFSTSEVTTLTEHLKYSHNMLDTALYWFYENPYTRNMRDLYNKEEQFFKFAKYLWNRDHNGMGVKEAALDSMKWTFNYNEITRATAGMRTYAAPFFTWQAKVLPLMAETAVKHPVRFFKWPMFMWGMQQYGMMQQNINDSEWQGINSLLPEYIKDGQFGLMPWRDNKNRLQLLNFTYIMPGLGDMSQMISDPASYTLGAPLISLGGAILSKTRFSGAPLYYDWETPTNKVLKTLGYVYQNLAPGMAAFPGSVNWGHLMDTINDDPNAMTWSQMVAGEMGMKITPLNLEKLARQRNAIDAIHRSEMARDLQKAMREARSGEDRQEALKQYNKSLQRLNRKRAGLD